MAKRGQPPKSGRERKNKSSARKKAEKQVPAHWRPEDEKDAQRNNLYIKEFLRWNTDATDSDFKDVRPQDLKAKDLAILVTRRNMLSPEPKVANSAVQNLISMERMNQTDQTPKEKDSQQHNHLHLHGSVGPLAEATDQEILDAKSLLFQVRNKEIQ